MLISTKLPNCLTRILVPLALALAAFALTSAPALAAPRASHAFSKHIGSPGEAAGQLKEPQGVAINESTGDIYVADKGNDRVDEFETSNGKFVRAWGSGVANGEAKLETCTSPCQKGVSGSNPGEFSSPESIAVDNDPSSPSFGDVYVADQGHKVIDKFSSTGAYINSVSETPAYTSTYSSNATDSVPAAPLGGPLSVEVQENGQEVLTFEDHVTKIAVAVGSSGELWVDQEAETQFGSSQQLISEFSGVLANTYIATKIGGFSKFFDADSSDGIDTGAVTGVAVGDSTGDVYVDYGDAVARFNSEGAFDERFGTGGELTSGTGLAVTDTAVVYVADSASGVVDEYKNEPGKPGVEGDAFSKVSALGATVSAQVNTYGLPTTYTVEYGTTSTYGQVSKTGTIPGSYNGAVAVSATLEGLLQPETTYHVRVVATNADGTEPGEDLTFTTQGDFSGLPDGRGFEMVSPVANADGNVYQPIQDDYCECTSQAMRAAADGDAVEYVADPPATGGNGNVGFAKGNEYVAARAAAGGWSAMDLETPGLDKAPYEAPLPNELSNSGTSAVPADSDLLSEARSVVLAGEGKLEKEFREDVKPELEEKKKLQAEAAKLKEEGNLGSAGTVEDVVDELPRTDTLYESAGGRRGLVDVLANGAIAPDATLGGEGGDFSHVISSNGSRVFWTQLEVTGKTADGLTIYAPEALYVREDATTADARTVLLADHAQFWTASPDGRYAFYTEGEKLWRFDVATETREELAGAGADALGVIGVNETGEDGSYLYFVADGVLGDGAEHGAAAGACKANSSNGAPEGTCNLYVLHDGVTTFIAMLNAEDLYGVGTTEGGTGVVTPGLASRTAEVSPDGHAVVFQSHASLTGYDKSGCTGFENRPVGCKEVYIYDADTARTSCVSCNPTGAPPTSRSSISLPVSFNGAFMRRWVSEDGARVFFQSNEALVAQDTNGVTDVYEWEREGAGSCTQVVPARPNGGCIYLLSGGTSSEPSYLVDASTTGDDVFIVSRAKLAPQDPGETYELYDARVGATEPPSEQTCTGTGCQGLPSAAPPFATPSSATFNGIGNFPAGTGTTTSTVVKPPVKKAAKCQKGKTRNKQGQCVKSKKQKAKAKKSAHINRRTSR